MIENNTLNIKISMGTLFKIAVFILCVYFVYQLKSLVLALLASIVIASVIEPLVKWLVKKNIPRVLSAILVYILIFAIVLSVFTFVIPPLLKEAVSAIQTVPASIRTIDILDPSNRALFRTTKTIFPDIPSTISVGDILSTAADSISSFSGGIFDTASSFFGGVISLVLVIVISFYLSVREDGVGEFLAIVTPLKHEKYVRGLWARSEHKIGRWMQGQLALGIIVFILVYIGLLIIDIKHPLLLALLAGIFELIPVVGMTLSAIPAFFMGVLDGGIGVGLFIIGLYLVIQQIEAHVIYPLVVKKVVGVPPLLVIIALVAGAQLAGLIGAILAVPISVGIVEYLDDVERKKRVETE